MDVVELALAIIFVLAAILIGATFVSIVIACCTRGRYYEPLSGFSTAPGRSESEQTQASDRSAIAGETSLERSA